MSAIPQTPYSPGVAPSGYFLFTQLNKVLHDNRFGSIEAIKENIFGFQGQLYKKV